MILYHAMYEAIAQHSRLGLNVVVDVGHHDGYSVPRGILPNCAQQLKGLPVLFVGVRCPLEVIMERRRATWHVDTSDDRSIPGPVSLWQQAVHVPGIYDLEVDTSVLNSEECADAIRQRLKKLSTTIGFPAPLRHGHKRGALDAFGVEASCVWMLGCFSFQHPSF